MIFNMVGGKGNGESLIISDTTDSHGGIIRTITGKVVKLQTKTITPSSTQQVVDPDTGYDGFSQVTVEAGGGTPTIQSLSVTPLTSQQTFNSSSVDGYKPVTVAAMPSGSAKPIASISGTSATVSAGTNTLTFSKTVSNTPQVTAGYISSGTVGNTSVSLTADITTKAAATITPSTSAQTIASGTYLTGTQTISAMPSGSVTAPSSISGTSATVSTGTNTLTLTKTVSVTPNVTTAGYISSGTAGNASVSLTGSVTTKAAATITPGTSNQTIASGTYLTGTQTISGDADLVASNIVSGVQIFGVAGNVVLQNYYTGSSAPSSSTGSNGDLYLQT